MHIQVKCLAQGYGATLRQSRPVPETFRSKAASCSHHVTTLCMYMEYRFRYRDTEDSHCQGTCGPQWYFFTSHSKSVRWLGHLHGHVSRERYTVSMAEGRAINISTNLPGRETNPGSSTWQLGEHSTHQVIAPFLVPGHCVPCISSHTVTEGRRGSVVNARDLQARDRGFDPRLR